MFRGRSMHNFPSAGHPQRKWFISGFVLALVLPVLAGLLAAQDGAPKQPKKEEEEANPKTAKPVPKIDEAQPTTGLALEAQQATHPELQNLYRSLAVPHDVVTLKDKGPVKVAPL